MSEWLKLRTRDGKDISAYLAQPAGTAKGGLVLVQEIFGVNGHIRSVVEQYAKEGYAVIAPALFDRIEPGVELSYEGADRERAFGLYQRLTPEGALQDVAAAFQVIASEGTGAGVIGFCYGGLMSWLSATRGPDYGFRPKACVGYYAGGIGQFASEQPSCPVMLHFGADDSHIGMDQVEAVRQAHPEVQVFVYEGAGHAFNRDIGPSFQPEAAKLAKERTLAFFRQHLG